MEARSDDGAAGETMASELSPVLSVLVVGARRVEAADTTSQISMGSMLRTEATTQKMIITTTMVVALSPTAITTAGECVAPFVCHRTPLPPRMMASSSAREQQLLEEIASVSKKNISAHKRTHAMLSLIHI